eukprot:scaffold8802_cov45-Phaeocystis_antarctica.AAC.1
MVALEVAEVLEGSEVLDRLEALAASEAVEKLVAGTEVRRREAACDGEEGGSASGAAGGSAGGGSAGGAAGGGDEGSRVRAGVALPVAGARITRDASGAVGVNRRVADPAARILGATRELAAGGTWTVVKGEGERLDAGVACRGRWLRCTARPSAGQAVAGAGIVAAAAQIATVPTDAAAATAYDRGRQCKWRALHAGLIRDVDLDHQTNLRDGGDDRRLQRLHVRCGTDRKLEGRRVARQILPRLERWG